MFFFFNDTATTEIYTLSLHDALPILLRGLGATVEDAVPEVRVTVPAELAHEADYEHVRRIRGSDRKSTRLNSSHANISYAVFCLKTKKRRKARLRSSPQCHRCSHDPL